MSFICLRYISLRRKSVFVTGAQGPPALSPAGQKSCWEPVFLMNGGTMGSDTDRDVGLLGTFPTEELCWVLDSGPSGPQYL